MYCCPFLTLAKSMCIYGHHMGSNLVDLGFPCLSYFCYFLTSIVNNEVGYLLLFFSIKHFRLFIAFFKAREKSSQSAYFRSPISLWINPEKSAILYVIVVRRVGVMYLICINQGLGCVAPEALVNINQIHDIPTRVATNLYPNWAGIVKEPLETPAGIHSV